MKMLEKDVEAYLRKKVKAMGGRAYKWVSPGNAGVPDRIVVLPNGKVWFIELKRPGGKLSALQLAQIRLLAKLGQNVCVIYTKEEVDEWAAKNS